MECINIRQRFGSRLRISYDPCYAHKGVRRENLDPWMMQIPCQFGTIYPNGGDLLVVEMDNHNTMAKRVAAISGCELIQDGERERSVRFHVDAFDAVAAIVRPRRKRRISDAERQRLRDAGKRYRFGSRLQSAVLGAPKHSKATA